MSNELDWTEPDAPCPCGKGKQFKDCHEHTWKEFAETLNIPKGMNIPAEAYVAIQHKVEINKQQRQLQAEYGFELPYPFTEMSDGSKMRVIFNQIVKCPDNQGFYEFLLDVLVQEVSIEWINEEVLNEDRTRPPHFIAEQTQNLVRKYGGGKKQLNLNELEGNTRFIFALAYDIYSLKHSGHDISKMIDRLKNFEEFQGVRYEIGVAAIFARAGYKLRFLETSDEFIKPCEFIASRGNEEFLVEVKSKQKKGALHRSSGTRKTRIGKLLNGALSKTTNNLPMLVFIDVNAPKGSEKSWRKDAERSIDSVEATNPDFEKANYIILSTFPFHYDGEEPANVTDHIIYEVSPQKNPMNEPIPMLEAINRGMNYFGFPPPNLQ